MREASSQNIPKVCIIDAGGQYTKVIDRRIRELQVRSRDHNFWWTKQRHSRGCSKTERGDSEPPIFPSSAFCWGMQFINHVNGGQVVALEKREDGVFPITVDTGSDLFKELPETQDVLLTHGDSIKKVADGFDTIAKSGDIVAAIADSNRKIFGVQFHPEVDLTKFGKEIFSNFLNIAQVPRVFTENFRDEECIAEIREQVGETGKILVLISGGVDSCVLAALCFKAIGKERVKCLHIDNGFMRKVELVNAQRMFYNSSCQIYGSKPDDLLQEPSQILCKTVDPEQKRKIIGDTFIKLVKIEASRLNMSIDNKDVFLAQGTLRPDLIESASATVSSHADVIKVQKEAGRLVEPLRDFHKDEVRRLGARLGLPASVVNRQPFPGPGLAIRVLCADNSVVQEEEACGPLLKMLSNYSHCLKTPHTLLEKIKSSLSSSEHDRLEKFTRDAKLYTSILPIRSVGVQGDCRSYSQVACISGPPLWSELVFLAKLIPRICHTINRVCYLMGTPIRDSHFPNDTTPTTLSDYALSQLRYQTFLKQTQFLKNTPQLEKLSQMPVVLLPLHFDREPYSTKVGPCQRSVVIRPFISSDFMTGRAAIPGEDVSEECINEMEKEICEVPGITRLLYDLTSKPPGTTEWE
ncbi:unnamed protein product [Oikopleura dioica]|uniref:GMP synthase (glutamine-hydrolyzing) n=1 Tax=Oikopleura dioica TaxID=34765 RepID=E4XLI4_OIKDI|nr:unnamed protein product [Oikopleura dioica]